MLEMKVFREGSKAIFDDLKKRNVSDDKAKKVIETDKKWRELIEEGNNLRAERNNISRKIGVLKKKGEDGKDLLNEMSKIKKKLGDNESETKEILSLREETRMRVPNILDSQVPQGKNEQDNQELSLHGTKKKLKTMLVWQINPRSSQWL